MPRSRPPPPALEYFSFDLDADFAQELHEMLAAIDIYGATDVRRALGMMVRGAVLAHVAGVPGASPGVLRESLATTLDEARDLLRRLQARHDVAEQA